MLALQPIDARAADYRVRAGAAGGDGSAGAPWDSVGTALGSGRIRAGDRIILAEGRYGRLRIDGANFPGEVLIVAEAGARAHFEDIEVNGSSNLTFRGLSVWPLTPKGSNHAMIRSGHDSLRITFQNFDVRGAEDAAQYRRWSQSDWQRNKTDGFQLFGARNVVASSAVTGIGFGISTDGDDSQIIGNRIVGYSGDGIRSQGDNSLVAGNLIQDCVKIDGNHDDGIQSWTNGPDGTIGAGVQRGLTISGNRILEWDGPRNHPLVCELQGMLFGAQQVGIVIQNNLVSASAYHGISAAGVTGGLISNNTLVNAKGPSDKAPWIGILGGEAQGTVIANNAAPAFSLPGGMQAQVRQNANIVLVYPAQVLRGPYQGDFRPAAGAPLIDAGIANYAPKADIDGTPRPLGARPDIGAWEVQ